jgi:hypothetical protein
MGTWLSAPLAIVVEVCAASINYFVHGEHCSQDPDAIQMHQQYPIEPLQHQRRLDWESSSSPQKHIIHKNIYIKAGIADSVSVVMAEAAALALAAAVTERLHLNNINFLSDNQELVNFFNNRDRSMPPGGLSISHITSSTQQCRETQVYSR